MENPTPEPAQLATIAEAPRLIESGQGYLIKHPSTAAEMNIKVLAEETSGAYSLVESVLPPGGVIPPHVHATEDENNYIVEGEMLMTIGDSTYHATAGSFIIAPKGMVQTFKNPGDAPCRFMTTFIPGGAEGFFKEAAELVAKLAPARPSPEALKALQGKYNLTYL